MSAGQTGQATVLVVDDEEFNRKLLVTQLAAEGYAVRTAANGEEALAAVAAQLPDLILLDIMMPGIDGFEVALQLKADSRSRSIPIILVTSLGDRDSRLRGLEAGAAEFLTKPVDRAELKVRVRNLLMIKELNDLLASYNRTLEKQVEARTAELRESEARYRRITEGLTDYLYTVRIENGRAVETLHSQACAMVTGYTAQEFAANTSLWIQMVVPEDRELVLKHVREIMAGHDGSPIEHRIIRKNGEMRWIRDTTILLKDASGKLLSYDGVVNDITGRKQAEQEILKLNAELETRVRERTAELELALATLSVSQENLSVTLNSIGDAVVSTDAEGRVVRLNLVAERLSGWTRAEAVGHPIDEILHIINEKTRLPALLPVSETIAHGTVQGLAGHTLLIARDGSERHIADSCAPIRNRAGEVIGAVLVFRDVNDEYAAQAALRNSAAHIQAIFNTVLDGIITIDERGTVETVNPAVERIFGYAAAEVNGQNIKMLMPEPYHSQHDGYLDRYRTTSEARILGKKCEVAGRRKDGSTFPLDIAISEMRTGEQRHFVGVVRDITQHKQLEESLRQAKEAAEQANRTKDAFLANMSHELRTPLNAIIGFSEALKDGLMGEVAENQREYIDDIYTSGEHLLSLINDILDLAKVESGQMALELEPVSLQAMLQNSLSMVKEKALTHQLNIKLVSDNGLPEIAADQRKLKQIVYNLLSNAVKFTPDGGDITLSAQRVGNMLEIAVADTGIGISAENQAKLFQPFTQIDSALSRQYQGTGLGLVMIKRMAELHGGSVGMESEVGKGSRFWARIPWRDIL